MTYDFNYQLLATDVPKIQSATIGRYFRLLFKSTYTFTLMLNVFFLATERASYMSYLYWGMVVLSIIMLFDLTLIYRPYLWLRSSHARIQIDHQNLTSSLGNKHYEIPWQYFAERGSVIENDDHFYLNCKLGKVFVPKRAFQNEEDIQNFREDISQTIGNRFEHGQLENA